MRTLLVATLSLLVFASDAHAQLGGLVGRARRAAQEAVQDRTPERQTPPTQQAAPPAVAETAPTNASSDEPIAPTGAMPVSPQGYAPGVDMVDWLEKLAFISGTGSAEDVVYNRRYSETRVVFPVPDARYQVVIRDAGGAVVTFQDLNLDIDRDLTAFGSLSPRNSPENRARPPFTLQPGTYRFAITAEGHEIGAVPVTVVEEGSDDPFDQRSSLYVTGPWKDLGVFKYDDEEDGLEFTFWLSPAVASEDGARVVTHLYRGSTRLTDDRATTSLWESSPGWTAFSKGLYKARGQLTLGDLSDGDYRIELAEEGRPAARTYSFRVQGGQIVPHGRSALDHPRPDFLTPSRGRVDRGGSGMSAIERLVWIEAD